MFFYSDLHIHSKYSRATSKSCNLEELALWAQKKGLTLISTGDFTHPAWFEEIKEKLIPAGTGVFKLRPDIEKHLFQSTTPVRFILSVEISTIYKKWDKTRKVHHVVFMPDLKTAEIFRQKLSAIGNIKSDGRPILGLDSRDLLEIALDSGENSFLIPAHIWTPWFSALGSKSGFDSIEDCYGDLSSHIFAVETGLSSDPEMNWRVSSLDKYRLVSNSDAHSPSKLAREATVFDTEPDYMSIMNALRTGDGYVGTVEFFPEEGKYHEDGHRKCNVCLSPEETIKLNGICPVCHKPMTIGVMHRVNELTDRMDKTLIPPETAGKVFSLVPLPEILSEIMQVGVSSKSVTYEYENLIQKLGSELSILREIPIDDISKAYSPLLGEGISRLRAGKVIKHPGYDGEYGVIRLFEPDELARKSFINLKLDINLPPQKTTETQPSKKADLQKDITTPVQHTEKKHEQTNSSSSFDEAQEHAIKNENNQLIITAGPGAGKTTVLTRRIAYLISQKNVPPESCLAITFTKKAAGEMRERLKKLLPEDFNKINIHTFHSLCFSILKQNYQQAGLDKDFMVISEQEKKLLEKEYKKDKMLVFDDLISLTLKLFEENPSIKESYQKLFQFVSVDEYQDIDKNQYKLIKLLVPQEGNICAIGDPNQAIYGFRGGNPKFFNSFAQDYPKAKIINLKNNYRSAANIVDASNQMLNSFNIISKYGMNNEKITLYTAQTDKAEAEFIVKTTEDMIGGHSFFSLDSNRASGEGSNLSFSDFAILYRTSSQIAPVEEALKRSGMPYAKFSNNLLCDNKHIQTLIKKLTTNISITEQLKLFKQEFSDKIEDYIWEFLSSLASNYNSKDEFIHELSLLSEIDLLDKRADRIALMTLHAAKGLEFECAFITGLEEEIVPFYLAQTQQELEEEKRLLYVGMTRAKQKLFLTRAEKRLWRGKLQHLEPSPFLNKIEENLLDLTKYEKTCREKETSNQLSLF